MNLRVGLDCKMLGLLSAFLSGQQLRQQPFSILSHRWRGGWIQITTTRSRQTATQYACEYPRHQALHHAIFSTPSASSSIENTSVLTCWLMKGSFIQPKSKLPPRRVFLLMQQSLRRGSVCNITATMGPPWVSAAFPPQTAHPGRCLHGAQVCRA